MLRTVAVRSLLVFFALQLNVLASTGNPQTPKSPDPLINIGLNFSYIGQNYNSFQFNEPNLTSSSRNLSSYNNGYSFGINLEYTPYAYPKNCEKKDYIGLKLNYSFLPSKFNNAFDKIAMFSYNNTTYMTDAALDFDLQMFDLGVSYNLNVRKNFFISLGASVSKLIASKYKYELNFPSGLSEQNVIMNGQTALKNNGRYLEIPGINDLRYGLSLGFEYKIFNNRKYNTYIKAEYNYCLNKMLDNIDWKINTFNIGIGVTYSLTGYPCSPSTPIDERNPM